MEEGEWGGETGRRLGGAPLGKRGGREYKKGGVKSDLAQQYNWGVQPGMTEKRPIVPKEGTPAGRPALSVDKHQDLTRRTHHQDPCGREGPFPRNVLVQGMVNPSFPSYNTHPTLSKPSSSIPTPAAAYRPRLSCQSIPRDKKSVRRNLP